MSSEFRIRFSYNNQRYNARVVKSLSESSGTSYAVRPFSLTLAKGFGPQTVIFKRNNHYSCDSILGKTTPGYIDALVEGLKKRKE